MCDDWRLRDATSLELSLLHADAPATCVSARALTRQGHLIGALGLHTLGADAPSPGALGVWLAGSPLTHDPLHHARAAIYQLALLQPARALGARCVLERVALSAPPTHTPRAYLQQLAYGALHDPALSWRLHELQLYPVGFAPDAVWLAWCAPEARASERPRPTW